jgi:NUMOD4 motif/HNH endonuclease
MEIEIWKPIPNYPDYQVSNTGRVMSFKSSKPKELRQHPNGRGYLQVVLWKDSRPTTFTVHRLVLIAFVGNRLPDQQCRHLDGNQTNNNLENLCWGTAAENIYDVYRHRDIRAQRKPTSVGMEELARAISSI